MKLCLDLLYMAYPIKLEQLARDKFRVTYGNEVKGPLTYDEAARELGASMMHAAALDGRLDSSEPKT